MGHLYGFTPGQVRDLTPEEIDVFVTYYNKVMDRG